MRSVTVRRLGQGDEREVERFAAAFDEPIRPDSVAAFLGDDRHHLLVAPVDEQPAGFELGCTIWVLTEDNAAAMASYRRSGGIWNGDRSIMFEIDLT